MADQGTQSKRSWINVTLTSPDGAQLRCTARTQKRSGVHEPFVTYATPRNAAGKRENRRGATQTAPTFEAAVKAMHALVETATKAGWARRQGGFVAKADAFDAAHIPAPGKAPAPIAKK